MVRVDNNTSTTLILNTGGPQECMLSPLLTAYREEVRDLTVWCKDNNLSLNVIKTEEMIVDYRKRRTEHTPILIDGAVLEQVEIFMFFGVHITNKLTWSKHAKTIVKRARQNLFPPQEIEKIWHGYSDPKKVYSCTFESILTGCITAWYGNCSASDLKALQRVVHMAQYITGAELPAIQDLYTRRCPKNYQRLQPPKS